MDGDTTFIASNDDKNSKNNQSCIFDRTTLGRLNSFCVTPSESIYAFVLLGQKANNVGYSLIFGHLLLPPQGIFNLPHHVSMVWEQLAFDDAVSYTQRGNGLQQS